MYLTDFYPSCTLNSQRSISPEGLGRTISEKVCYMRMREIVLALCSLAALTSPCLAQTARIAAWNVGSGRGAGAGISEDRAARIGKIIATKIKPDVIVLSEVGPENAAEVIAQASKDNGFPLNAITPPQNEGVFQKLSILYRPEVEVWGSKTIKGSDDLMPIEIEEEKSSRKAIVAKVRVGNFDFHVVGVHLKSKSPTPAHLDRPHEMRDRQCAVIADKIESLTKWNEKDLILVGDYNMTPGDPDDEKNFATLNKNGNLTFISNAVSGWTHIGYWDGELHRSKLDGYAVSNGTATEYIPGSFNILSPAELGLKESNFSQKWKKATYISDHVPIIAEFRTDAEDDD